MPAEPELKPGEPMQFSIRFLLMTAAIFAIGLLPIVYGGPESIVLSVWLVMIGMALARRRYPDAIGWGLCGCCMFLLLLPSFYASRPKVSPGMRCRNNLRQIAYAILEYELANGHLPPAYTTDENGKPMHSWRVLILPYLDEPALYNAFDFSKPWNHPDNMRLASEMPYVYRCPSDRRLLKPSTTSYVAITGPETAWPVGKRRSSANIGSPILVVESVPSRTLWLQPSDLKLALVVPTNNNGETNVLGSNHRNVSCCVHADGYAKYLPVPMQAALLAQKCKIATQIGTGN